MDIKQLREDQNLTQAELASRLGISQGSIANWENGTRHPNSSQRKKICEYFHISEAELYGAPKEILSPEILEALQDPVAVKALLATHKSKEDLKRSIQNMLECLPNMDPVKRNALLALCKG